MCAFKQFSPGVSFAVSVAVFSRGFHLQILAAPSPQSEAVRREGSQRVRYEGCASTFALRGCAGGGPEGKGKVNSSEGGISSWAKGVGTKGLTRKA